VAVLAPNDFSARAIGDVFATDKAVKSYVITGQDADQASLAYISVGRQTMTVFKDTRVEARDAITAALAFLTHQTPIKNTVTNNGHADIPTYTSAVMVVDKSNIKTAINGK